MGLYIGQTQINGVELLQTWNKSMLGCVNDIRFSIIDNTLYVKWRDPDDSYQDGMVVAKFGGTKLVMKVGDYPVDQDDGTMIVNNTIRNQYNDTGLTATLPTYEEEVEYYFRFFSYDDSGNFNGKTQLSYQNRFSSASYSWNQVVENLHNYAEDAALVPAPGTVINLKYMLNDYYTIDGGVKVALDTRQKVYDAREHLEPVTIPWVILGHNKNVPQYVNYRRREDASSPWENIFVCATDDTFTQKQVYELSGEGAATTMGIRTGDGFFRQIAAGCRTYTESYDLIANVHSYAYTGDDVQAVGEATFTYANEGCGTQNAYTVPMEITVGGKSYQFCGYTMTMMPVHCLAGSTTTTFYSNIQFDQPELGTALVYKAFPSTATDARYFYLDGSDYHEIDWIGENLFGSNIVTYASKDVYELISDGSMALRTSKFKAGLTYFKIVDGTEVNLTAGTDYTVGDTITTTTLIYVRNHNDRRNNGSNLYSESNMRQYLNNERGFSDAAYGKQNDFDTISTSGMMQTNGPLLKMFCEQEWLSHVKKASIMVQIANPQQYYRPYKYLNNMFCECCSDRFWLMGNYEVFGNGTDGSATFNVVFPNNEARKRYVLTANGAPSSSSQNWWLRTPYASNAIHEYVVTTSGTSDINYAHNSYCVLPACIIG